MRLGIHKLGLEAFCFDPDFILRREDKNGMYTELGLVMQAFIENGYEIEYVDTTRIYPLNHFDIIFIFNGYDNRTSCLELLRYFGREICYLLTDSRYYELAASQGEYIDSYFVQSEIKMFDKPTYNSKLHKLPIYEKNFYKNQTHAKNGRLIFGGSVRERREQITELLVDKPGFDVLLKDEEEGYDNRMNILDYKTILGNYSYGIVIINPLDIEIGSITWRYYEYISNKVLTFVEAKSDPYNQLLPKGSFMYVDNYKDLHEKIAIIGEHEEINDLVINEQNKNITHWDAIGKTFVQSLLESRELNVRK